VELHKGDPRNIVTALTTTMADVSEGKTANTFFEINAQSKWF
jgi:hypothetical protein